MKRCRSSIKIKTWVRKLLVWIINDKLLTRSGYKKFQRGILSLTDIYCNVVRDILTPYNLTHYNSYDGFHLSFVLMKTWCQIEQEVYICLLPIDFNILHLYSHKGNNRKLLAQGNETENVRNTERGCRLMMMLDNGIGKAEQLFKSTMCTISYIIITLC